MTVSIPTLPPEITVSKVLTLKSPVTVKSLPIVTSLGNPTVTVLLDATVVISLDVPITLRLSDNKSTVPIPVSAPVLSIVTTVNSDAAVNLPCASTIKVGIVV